MFIKFHGLLIGQNQKVLWTNYVNWIVKAFIQKILSGLPNSSEINYLFQKKVTKTFPINERVFLNSLEHALEHIQRFKKYREKIENAHIFEFGAGWHIVGPLTYAALGANEQTIIDLTPKLKHELVQVTVEYIRKNRSLIEKKYGEPVDNVFFVKTEKTPVNIRSLGINYKAPADARSTGLENNSCDLIVNTNTLEHIPPQDIQMILAECYRILKPGGILSCIVDLIDHFSYCDTNICEYNFLKFSSRSWEIFFNSHLQYQNRLRAGEYLKLLDSTGFRKLVVKTSKPENGLKSLSKLKLNKRFRVMKPEDIAITRLDVLLAKP